MSMITLPLNAQSEVLGDCDMMFRIGSALGLTPVTAVDIIATNSDLDTTEDILCWPPGVAYTIPAAAAQIYVSSSNNSDTTQVVTINYLTAAYAQKTVTITLAGQTKTTVTGASDVFRINSATVSAACAGNVWIYFTDTVTSGVPDNPATKACGYIPATYQATRQAIYTIPAGYYGLLVRVEATIGASATAKSYDLHVYSKVGTAAATLLSALTVVSSGLSVVERKWEIPRLLQPGTDLYCKNENASANDCYAECEVELWLIPTAKVGRP